MAHHLRILSALILTSLFLSGCAEEGARVREGRDGRWTLTIDGRETFIKGIGGTQNADMAAQNAANAMRTWGGDVEGVRRTVGLAKANDMYVMQGIGLTKDLAEYSNEAYKGRVREQVRALAEEFKDDGNIFAWGIGNEMTLDQESIPEVWRFVDELSLLIKSIDHRHLTATVIQHDPASLDSIAKYAPSLDFVGVNSYGQIGEVAEMVGNSAYTGPYMITEWGPTGWWETDTTAWGAPIEQTSEEKRAIYESRYNDFIQSSPRCIGSFCFLWGQKEERTPTWFCMFVEKDVDGLPLRGEKTPMVEAMLRVWSGKEPAQTAPVVSGMTVGGVAATDSPRMAAGRSFVAEVAATDREGDTLTYVWEVLREATQTATGGAFEPRPERVGDVVTTDAPQCAFTLPQSGDYRLYCYVLDGTGYAATANVPFRVE